MKSMGKLIPHFKKYFLHYTIGILALLIVDMVQLYIPKIIGEVTDGLKEGTLSQQGILQAVGVIMGITVIIVMGRFVWRYYIFGASRHIEYRLRNQIFSHLEKLSLQYFTKHKTGDLMAHVTNDLNAVRMAIGPGVVMMFDSVVMTILVIVTMAGHVNVPLTILAVIPLPFIAIGGTFFGRSLRKRFRDKQDAFAKLTDEVQENISGIRVIKAFVQEAKEVLEFEKANRNNFDKNMQLVRTFAIMLPLLGIVTGISILIALAYGGYLTMVGEISLGKFVAFNQYLGMLVWPMMALGWCINIFSQGIASWQRIQAILDEIPDIYDLDTVKQIKDVQGKIQIQNLTFDYPCADEDVLQEVNLVIEKGQTLAVLGRTGSGKTTLVNLLLRLYNPPRGTILIDGEDILDIPLATLRQHIGYVPQDNFLFSDTIANNIAFGVNHNKQESIERAAEAANVHHNIMDFKEKYSTVVGERGVTLSGGQKQRISIARAMIKDAAILILDDALSAVDTHTEEEILKNLRILRQGKTNIMIAHRITTVQDADYIVVLDEGKIVERGTHEQLMAYQGLYYDMVQKQKLEEQLEEA